MAKKRHRDMRALIEKYCQDYDFEVSKNGHIKVTLNHKGRSTRITASGSPSCRHAIKNFERDVARAIQAMDAGQNPGFGWGTQKRPVKR